MRFICQNRQGKNNSLINSRFTNKYNHKIANCVRFLRRFIPLIFNKLENKNENFTLFMNR